MTVTIVNPVLSMDDKIRELTALLNLYDNAIEKQKTLIRKISKGLVKYTQVSDNVLSALAQGELKLLERKKSELEESIDEFKSAKDRSIANSDI